MCSSCRRQDAEPQPTERAVPAYYSVSRRAEKGQNPLMMAGLLRVMRQCYIYQLPHL